MTSLANILPLYDRCRLFSASPASHLSALRLSRTMSYIGCYFLYVSDHNMLINRANYGFLGRNRACMDNSNGLRVPIRSTRPCAVNCHHGLHFGVSTYCLDNLSDRCLCLRHPGLRFLQTCLSNQPRRSAPELHLHVSNTMFSRSLAEDWKLISVS